jgi:hypothetical protein
VEDVDAVVRALAEIVKELRSISPLGKNAEKEEA